MADSVKKYFLHIEENGSETAGNTRLVSSRDHDIIGFYYENAWIREPEVMQSGEVAYAFDMLYAFVGQNREQDRMLGAELSFTIMGHEYITEKTCMILIPKNTPHGPIVIRNVKTPFFFYSGGGSREPVPVDASKWRRPEGDFSFSQYVLHANGIDNNEAEHEVLRLHGEDNQMLGGFGGIFYGKFRWFKITTPEDFIFAAESHSHSHPEILNFYGTDSDHPEDLGAEIAVDMLDETYRFNKSTSLFVPSNQPHCPLKILKVTRPFMFFTLIPDCQVYQLDK